MNTRLLIPTGLILGLCAASPFAQSPEAPTNVPATYSETVSNSKLFKGSTLMGLEIRSLERDAVCATVEDALIKQDGCLGGLIVSTEEGPDGLVILPLDVVSIHGEKRMDDAEEPRPMVHPVKSAVLKVDAKKLAEAPRLVGEDRDGPLTNARWLESTSYFGIESNDERDTESENTRDELAHATPFHRASALIDHEVLDDSNESLGEISDFAFANDGDEVRYVVLECGGVMGLGEKQFAVPFNALEQVRVDDERTLRVPVSAEEIENLEGFERWPRKANSRLFAKADHRSTDKES